MRHASFVEDNPWFDMSNAEFDRPGNCFNGPAATGEVRAKAFAVRRASTDLGHTGFDGCPMNFAILRNVSEGHHMKTVAWSWQFDNLGPSGLSTGSRAGIGAPRDIEVHAIEMVDYH